MFNSLYEIVSYAKYAIIAIGVLGIILLIAGFYRKQQPLKVRGGYLIVLAVVLGICGYFIYQTTVDRANQMIENSFLLY